MPEFNPDFRTQRAPADLLDRAIRRSEHPAPARDLRVWLAAACFLGGLGLGVGARDLWFAPAPESGGGVSAHVAVGEAAGPTLVPVRFVFPAPGAERVAIAGTWNDWSETSHPLVRGDGDTFYLVVPLAPGQYEYQFVVDGKRWQPDPAAPLARDDGFGQRNSVLTI